MINYYDLLSELDCNVQETDLPGNVNGLIVQGDSGSLILLNCALCDQAKEKALEHEINHLLSDDFKEDRYPHRR